ncbi:MAG TPA: serine protease [Methylomirabilota bacterium]|nr:serine protease [Methylomirabilota bacterium]
MARAMGGTRGRGLLACALLLVLGAGCATDRLWAPTREEVLQRILPPTVQIVLEQDGRRFRSGSGVVVAARSLGRTTECLVLTSGHTLTGLTDGQEIYVLLGRHQGKGVRARATMLVRRDGDDLDLGLLRIETERCVAARLGQPPALGDAIWVVAFPWGRSMTLVGGIVSQVNPDGGDDADAGARLMVDASVSYGASGGGVFEATTGRLVGVVEGYRTARVSFKGDAALRYIDVPVPGETYVTPLADIRRFLGQAGQDRLVGDQPLAAGPKQ